MIRRALPGDVARVHALVERGYRGDSARQGWTHEADLLDGQRIDAEAVAAIVADPKQSMLLAQVDETLLGCVVIADSDAGLAYLGMLAVDPARQARGTGRALVAAAQALAHEAFGATRIEMTVIARRTGALGVARLFATCTAMRTPFYSEVDPLCRTRVPDDRRFGLPRTLDLDFAVLERTIGSVAESNAALPLIAAGPALSLG